MTDTAKAAAAIMTPISARDSPPQQFWQRTAIEDLRMLPSANLRLGSVPTSQNQPPDKHTIWA